MNPTSSFIFAEIPLIDWSGPDFLRFYAVAYIVAAVWTWQRIRTRSSRFDIPGPPQHLSDPYEIALLAGDKPRVMEVLLLKMLNSGAIAWDNRWSSPRLILTGTPAPMNLSLLERTLLDRIGRAGPNGWPVEGLRNGLDVEYQRLESGVAAKGFRPTRQELLKSKGEGLPLIILAVLGGIKLLVGLDRGRPVGFLFVALAITLLTKYFLMKRASSPKQGLTPAGEAALEKVRRDYPTPPQMNDAGTNPALWSIGPALFGMTAVAAATQFPEALEWLQRRPIEEPAPTPATGGSSSDGGSSYSSCSSSSDSGGGSSCSSGCGGCGGGGGD